MAPEQLTGGRVTPATDVFALGTVLAFAATTVGPFGTGSAQARVRFPAEDQWLERACWPADLPTVPLDQFDGSFWPPVLVERLEELRAIATRAWLAPTPAAAADADAAT